MSSLSLTELCSGLPLDPLPSPRSRDPSLPHAPVRTPDLSPAEKKVIRNYFRSYMYIMHAKGGFHGAWLHFRKARVGSVFSAAVCKIQASKHYIESLPLVPKDKRSCFSQDERSAVQLPRSSGS